MNFTRSAGALFAVHRFYQVDVVVFCEGGFPLSYADAMLFSDSVGTLDTLYWSSVVSHLGVNKTFHFKSVGSKSTINKIAEEVYRLNLGNVTVCRDSDYDRVLQRHITFSRVAWSMGYSWESDVVSLPVLERLVTNLLGGGLAKDAAIQEIGNKIGQLERDLQRWVEVDISLCARGYPGIFEREKPLAAIDMTAPPTLRTHALASRLASTGYKRKPRKVLAVAVGNVRARSESC
jgi:hypothetical protein